MTQVRLADNEVHVWRLSVDREAACVSRLWTVLDDQERARAAAFCFPNDRQRFIVVRAVLRLLLGRYLDLDPTGLRLEAANTGKLRLASAWGDIQFNVSHSCDVALIAVSARRTVGVDVERIRGDLPIEELAHRVFSPRELTTLLSFRDEQRLRAFFAGWTRKEAYLKGRGVGLARALDQFDVSLAPGEPARLLADRAEPAAPARWSLRDLAVGVGYAAALAVAGTDWQLSAWQWQS